MQVLGIIDTYRSFQLDFHLGLRVPVSFASYTANGKRMVCPPHFPSVISDGSSKAQIPLIKLVFWRDRWIRRSLPSTPSSSGSAQNYDDNPEVMPGIRLPIYASWPFLICSGSSTVAL